jgi:hypothetical protein
VVLTTFNSQAVCPLCIKHFTCPTNVFRHHYSKFLHFLFFQINHYAPGLLDKVKVHSVEAWELVKQNALILWHFSLQYSYLGLEWFKTNVFV